MKNSASDLRLISQPNSQMLTTPKGDNTYFGDKNGPKIEHSASYVFRKQKTQNSNHSPSLALVSDRDRKLFKRQSSKKQQSCEEDYRIRYSEEEDGSEVVLQNNQGLHRPTKTMEF